MSVTSTPRTPQSSAGKAREPAGAGGRTPEEELVHRMAACPAGPDREALREAAITAYLPVARRIARRYGSPDRSREDLDQVACLGLVKAVDRFDPGLGHAFLSYAVPTIDGELKRFLRDFTWQVHVPRRLQDKHRRVRLAQEELNRAGRSDGGTVRDIQRLTGIDEEDVRLALRADRARNPLSVDEQRGTGKGCTLAETIGGDDPRLELVTDLVALRTLVAELPARERAILKLYFVNSLTQRQVADIVGLSQMHVSRLLDRSCAFLRRGLLGG
ncbi:sigma-70 family RNA polymerase sigma factor [Streptomyces sp. BB1-1-1]|uniref:sigma-70 family RNA polymerase sigma factor n=1 Tax=Streptomyces sp. BB1-1-1 TaxID=3074430 RepID=UPI0028772C22|nr:sigma-70 family RNA polymerase sigma factor [Streptomyces sp. BB1-1-1]WND39431.1 sigma-70 family RNA polymerase sigma factor [Streptomyces sp. BB1-1-1]